MRLWPLLAGKRAPVPRPPNRYALEEAMRRLHHAGLHGSVVPSTPPRIVGGRRVSRVAGGTAYEGSFSIAPEGRAWLVRIERGTRHVETVHTDSLENAVRMVLSVCTSR